MNDDSEALPGTEEQLQVDAQALRGLAHPLRARILDELALNGPATATLLGRRLGESSGATSYHLRQLSRYGFIGDEPGRAGGRERWWRIRPGGWRMRGHEFLSRPETRAVVQGVLGRYYQQRQERFERWTASVSQTPDAPAVRRWKDAATDSTSHVRMTPEETVEFAEALHGFLRSQAERLRDRTPETHPGTESVELQVNLFPVLPEAEED
ncbi:transcriptional regulator [Nocardiopsis sp. TSRI0078]|uniref:ArsR/SmtB family transcription factor n=1 Tax=unclassified Nocardiopsis TaxID=2649073 RepID=UPI0009404317|nr:helix-turn-helix domain-containing protein [Nocardiopsis sp. TSRI0078]OKI17978.1 transcriptional regulator [Nocardiopsis sp. TSRI0078]